METIVHNPTEGIYASTGDYVHALEIRVLRAAPVRRGDDGPRRLRRTGGDARRPTPPYLAQPPHHPRLGRHDRRHRLRLTSYLRDAAFAEANGAARGRRAGRPRGPDDRDRRQGAGLPWLVEIEGYRGRLTVYNAPGAEPVLAAVVARRWQLDDAGPGRHEGHQHELRELYLFRSPASSVLIHQDHADLAAGKSWDRSRRGR